MEALQSLQFSVGTIKVATDNFADENKLGEGASGTVYKVTTSILFLNSTMQIRSHIKGSKIYVVVFCTIILVKDYF